MDKNTQGFTLLETLVAVTILIIGVLGPLSLASRGIADGLFAQNQLTASFLAEEALETLKSRRDGNVLSGNDPFLNLTGFGSGEIELNGLTGEVKTGCGVLGPNNGCVLIYDDEDDLAYIPATGSETGNFERKIEITGQDLDGDTDIDQLKNTVTIYWKNKNVDREFSLVGYLYGQ
jgi:type II secretory pathway pseudopilin PulG